MKSLRSTKTKELSAVLCLGLCGGFSMSARADILNFNSGIESATVGTVGSASFTNAIYASPGAPAVGFFRDTGPGDTIATGTPTTFITEIIPIAGQNPQGITIIFASPIHSLAFDLLDLDWPIGGSNERYTITLLDATNTSFVFQGLASDIFPSGTRGDGSVLPLSFSQTNITRVNILAEVVTTGDRAGIGIDNIQFVSVPEPATLSLLALSGVASLLRRRRQYR